MFKKIILYILIFITLVGIFNPAFQARAADLQGNCTVLNKALLNKPPVVWSFITEAKCRADTSPVNPQAFYSFLIWCEGSKIVKDGQCVDPPVNTSAATGAFGVCTEILEKDTQGPPQSLPYITEKDCKAKGTGWGWSPYYNFLEPLPCEEGKDGPGCVGGELKAFDPAQANNLGVYLNIMLRIFIGICAVLAVIMIVVGGLEYMTSELPGNKENGKDRIKGAIFGLVLALGAYTILYQINPDLLKTDLSSLTDQTVVVTLADETETPTSAVTGGDIFTGPTSSCSEGIKQSQSGVFVCARIADKLDQLITAARNANLIITGGGYRSPATQETLRRANCQGNITDPKAPCTPPTAVPGASRHNNGLAVDFKCSGSLIQTTDNACFVWLKANASKYSLSNLASEPWHWSVDGR